MVTLREREIIKNIPAVLERRPKEIVEQFETLDGLATFFTTLNQKAAEQEAKERQAGV